MPIIVILNKKGLSLIEVLIASTIVLILFLALMQSVMLSINVNIKNQLRDEAVNIAEDRMRTLRSLDFDDNNLTGSTTGVTHTNLELVAGEPIMYKEKSFRNMNPVKFFITHTVKNLGSDVKSIEVQLNYMNVRENTCSVSVNLACAADSDCPGGETCGYTQTITSLIRDD